MKLAKAQRAGPLEAECERLHRVLKILQLIQGQEGWDAQKLAEACDKKVRTIYRDIKLLQEAGIPVQFDEERRGYEVRGDYFMRPIDLTLEESLSLIALVEHVGRDGQIPFTQAAVRAMAKIRGQLPAALRREVRSIDSHLSIRLSEPGPREGIDDVYSRVQQAIMMGRCMRCRYESAGKKGFSGTFLFKPYVLRFERRAWYAIGYHAGHEAIRWLKLNRFIQATMTDHEFKVPASFNIDAHLGNAWRMIRGARTYDVEILFDPEFAENIADTAWHKTQKIDHLDDGSLRFRCKVDGLEEIQWWVLARGAHCKVIKPVELANRVRDLARKTAEQYGD